MDFVDPSSQAPKIAPVKPVQESEAKLVVTFQEIVDHKYGVDLVGGKGLKLAEIYQSLGPNRKVTFFFD